MKKKCKKKCRKNAEKKNKNAKREKESSEIKRNAKNYVYTCSVFNHLCSLLQAVINVC